MVAYQITASIFAHQGRPSSAHIQSKEDTAKYFDNQVNDQTKNYFRFAQNHQTLAKLKMTVGTTS